MDVVAQWVRTRWTKLSRGGAGAARRNAVPAGFHLPDVVAPLVHEVAMDEQTQFEPQWSLRTGEAAPEQVSISETDGALRVMVMAAPNGIPRRSRRPPALRLATGQWLRWQINYRFVDRCTGDWSYRQDTLNLAYRAVTADIFLGSPTRHLDERAHLR